jgi:uncharacterized integral membrane protein (TIGR00698 family)
MTTKAVNKLNGIASRIDLRAKKIIYTGLAVLCLFPIVSPPVALLMGLLVANLMGNPFATSTAKLSKVLLQVSVVGLGFGMNIFSAIKAGSQGVLFTVITIAGTLTAGYLLGRAFKIDKKTTSLVSSGTAICGGSAIAAVAPVINASKEQISVALGAVFILNSIALLVFPSVGHAFDMSQVQFGMWSAIAIHDTSSVVGAASKYGQEALEVATTIKLARALWIIPVSLAFGMFYRKQSGKIKIPWFIGLFILAMVLNTYVTPIQSVSPYVVFLAKAGLTLTLFLIGSSLSLSQLRSVGLRPFLLAVTLWVIISVASFGVVMNMIN